MWGYKGKEICMLFIYNKTQTGVMRNKPDEWGYAENIYDSFSKAQEQLLKLVLKKQTITSFHIKRRQQ